MAQAVTLTTGRHLDGHGAPRTGTLRVRATHAVVDAFGVAQAITQEAPLIDGSASLSLIASDSPGVTPRGFGYWCQVLFDSGTSRTPVLIMLPSALATADLDTVVPPLIPGWPAIPSSTLADAADPIDQSELDALEGRVQGELDTLSAAVQARLLSDGSQPMTGALSIASSYAGGEDEGQPGTFDSTGRLNLESYQRADVGSYGETIRHYLRRKDAKAMEAWYFPSGGYDDVTREPRGEFKPVVWAGAHWEANNHASNHKHWSVETPDSDGSIETRFEVRWGNPAVETGIAGLDKTLIATNLADFVVRCTNGQVLRLSSSMASGADKAIEFNHDYAGSPQYRRWVLRATGEPEDSTGNAVGTNFQLARYNDAGTFVDTPFQVSRATGNVTLTPGLVVRRASATASSVSLNTTSLGGGIGVVALGNTVAAPAGTPNGGGVLYAEGGALKWKGSNGTVTTIAPA